MAFARLSRTRPTRICSRSSRRKQMVRFGRNSFSMNSLRLVGNSENPQVSAKLTERKFLFNLDSLKLKLTFDSGN
jgi:hypothetical protein